VIIGDDSVITRSYRVIPGFERFSQGYERMGGLGCLTARRVT